MGVRDAELILSTLGQKKAKAHTVADGTVVSVKGSTAYVTIDGGAQRVPCQLAMAAKAGDKVKVSIYNHSAVVTGNTTEPATGDAEAKAARERADEAFLASQEAQGSAQSAAASAQSAAESAGQASENARRTFSYLLDVEDDWEAIDDYREQAGETFADITQTAQDAETSANEAKASAYNANEYAARALGHLGTVESVTETLTWITEHGTMTLTTDTEPDPTHVYFVRDVNGDYTVGSYKYAIVIEPDPDDMATYYELSIDESLQNYVGTHLALDGEGLWVLPSSTGHRVLVATGTGNVYTTPGTYIIDPNGSIVARLGEFTTIGNTLSSYTSIRPDYLGMYDSNGLRYALFGNGIYSGAARYATYSGTAVVDSLGSASADGPYYPKALPRGTVITIYDSNGNDVTSQWELNEILSPASTGYQDEYGDYVRPSIGEGADFLYE